MSDVYKEWQQLGGQRDKQAWEMTPATVNAYYNPPGNEVGQFMNEEVVVFLYLRSFPDRLPSWDSASALLLRGVVRNHSRVDYLCFH